MGTSTAAEAIGLAEIDWATDDGAVRAREKAIAARYTGHFAWGALAEAIVFFGGWCVVTTLGVMGVVPLWAACLLNVVFAYCMYQPQHEANHNNISGRHVRLRWIDQIVGQLCSIPITISWQGFTPLHIQHHQHTNHPTLDPDFEVQGPLRQMPVKWAIETMLSVLSVIPPLRRRVLHRLGYHGVGRDDMPKDMKVMERDSIIYGYMLIAFVVAGFGAEAFVLWYLPAKIAIFGLMIVFQWLPHHPHTERGRYTDSRITRFFMSRVLCIGQDHHLLHHMFPSIPGYRLPWVYQELRPLLEAKGARIDHTLSAALSN